MGSYKPCLVAAGWLDASQLDLAVARGAVSARLAWAWQLAYHTQALTQTVEKAAWKSQPAK
jgi:hypothetical protein